MIVTAEVDVMCQMNWGRIATLVAFCSVLAEQCVRMEMPSLVPRIIDWTTLFVDTRLHSWIAANDGWVNLCCLCNVYVCTVQFHVVLT